MRRLPAPDKSGAGASSGSRWRSPKQKRWGWGGARSHEKSHDNQRCLRATVYRGKKPPSPSVQLAVAASYLSATGKNFPVAGLSGRGEGIPFMWP